HPLLALPLAPKEGEKLSEEDKKFYALARKHLRVRKGTFFLGKQGALCGSQVVTVREARKFVEGINGLISDGVAEMTSKALGDKTKKKGNLDEETLRLLQKAARDRHQWITFEPGRVSGTLVGSPQHFARLK